jgi:predicted flap endonuclease-1-like 5' DNA nuclease
MGEPIALQNVKTGEPLITADRTWAAAQVKVGNYRYAAAEEEESERPALTHFVTTLQAQAQQPPSKEAADFTVVSGVTRQMMDALYKAGYTSWEDVADARLSDLQKVPGFGATRARALHNVAKDR